MKESNAGPQFVIFFNERPVATGEITRSRYVRVVVEIIRPVIPHCRFDDDVIIKRIFRQVEADEVDNVGHDEPVSTSHIMEAFE